jgi:hypothetical protein
MSSLKSAKPVPDGGPAYDEDFVGWTEHQAALIRKYGASGALPGIDLDTLVEEIEGLGQSALNSVISLARNMLVHGVKLHSAPTAPAANHWRTEFVAFAYQLEVEYQRSMRRRIDVDSIWKKAVRLAGLALAEHGDTLAAGLPDRCPMTIDELAGCSDPDALATRLGS